MEQKPTILNKSQASKFYHLNLDETKQLTWLINHRILFDGNRIGRITVPKEIRMIGRSYKDILYEHRTSWNTNEVNNNKKYNEFHVVLRDICQNFCTAKGIGYPNYYDGHIAFYGKCEPLIIKIVNTNENFKVLGNLVKEANKNVDKLRELLIDENCPVVLELLVKKDAKRF